jgi:hypothetical protein
MKPKMTAFSAACLLCSMVLFPLFALGGLTALLLLAAGNETLRILMGEGTKRIDLSAARAAAMRICYGRLHHS